MGSVATVYLQLKNMKTISVILILTFTANLNELRSQSITKNLDDSRIEIGAINSRIERLYVTEDVNALTSLYASEFTFFQKH